MHDLDKNGAAKAPRGVGIGPTLKKIPLIVDIYNKKVGKILVSLPGTPYLCSRNKKSTAMKKYRTFRAMVKRETEKAVLLRVALLEEGAHMDGTPVDIWLPKKLCWGWENAIGRYGKIKTPEWMAAKKEEELGGIIMESAAWMYL